ncbi:Flagellar hook-length control protein FliK [Luteitalea pratensis]|uniref:Flagellar hook-length control protein FliK n=1 Tax=Luteitalea pratensis TaxID=1855912 RepID=A0A143PPS6_LUTPR|nr:flagellar hook-length control protein FliK [Luteitalea pratensis]AMY10431.1 Flagellar hook-length control protein FliK [Luteitalea pratensis]
MSLVPFPASTANARGPSSVARAAALPSKASLVPLAGRGHAAIGRSDAKPAADRPASRFAHVLAVVQEQKGPPAANANAGRAGRVAHVAEAETPEKVLDDADGSSSIVPVPVESPGAAPVQAPWLLLALGTGAYSRVDEAASESAVPLVECFEPAAEHALTIGVTETGVPAVAVAQSPAGEAGVSTLAMSGARAAAVGSPADAPATLGTPSDGVVPGRASLPGPVGVISDSSEPITNSPEDAPGGAALPLPPGSAPAVEHGPALTAQRAGEDWAPALGPEVASSDAPSANPAAEMLARWHVAARRSGGDVPAPPSIVAQRKGEATGVSRAPGQAVSRLAQALGTASRQEGAQVDGQSPLSNPPLPTARAADVLTRLALGESGSRDPREPGPSTAASGQVLTATSAGSPPIATATPVSATAAPLPPAAGEQVLHQLVSSIKMQWKDGIGEAKLHLRPDALGAVSVSLRVEGGAVTAVVRAESAQVQEWVLQHQQTLRQQMEAAGLTLDELVVSPDDQRQQSREESPEPGGRRPRGTTKDNQDPAAPRFELKA